MFDCSNTIRPALDDVLGTFEIERDDEGCRVVTPIQHHNGDLVRVWVESHRGDRFVIRDYGETFAMLKVYGVNPKSDANEPRVRELRQQFDLADGFEGELAVFANSESLGERIFELIQAIQGTSYLIYTHSSRQPSHFRTKVAGFLDDVGYDYEIEVDVQGATEPRTFDVGINHREPTVLLDTIHSKRPTLLRSQVDRVKLNWWEVHEEDYTHCAFVDNENGRDDEKIIGQLEGKLDHIFMWSEKEAITQQIPVRT